MGSRTLSDDELVKACGGRTAHKGARHGQRMTAKLQRVADAEKLYLEQLLKRNQEKEAAKKAGKNGGINPGKEVKDAAALKDVVVTDAKDAVERCKDASDLIDPAASIKKKKRKREEDNQPILNPAVVDAPEEQPVKKKKKKRSPLAEEIAAPEPTEEMAAPEPTEDMAAPEPTEPEEEP